MEKLPSHLLFSHFTLLLSYLQENTVPFLLHDEWILVVYELAFLYLW